MNLKPLRSLIVFCCFILIALSAAAQTSETQYFVPQLFPRSPTATALEKYGTYQVNEFTGIPDISIPLYTVEAGGLQVPITLSYHASGNKVDDIASWVGLGWSVSSGGQLSRRTMGLSDDAVYGYLSGHMKVFGSITSTTDVPTVRYLDSAASGICDTKPDIYSYDFPGHSGKFFFDGSAGNGTYPVRLVPYAPVKIQYTKPPPYTIAGAHFTITDEHGNRYLYGDAATDSTFSSSAASPYTKSQSAWKIETMISQNRRDTISFSYNKNTTEYTTNGGEVFTVVDNPYNFGTDTPPAYQASYTIVPTSIGNSNITTENVPGQINFKNGQVVFDLDTISRTDTRGGDGGEGGYYAYGLHDIKVYGYNYGTRLMELQKTIMFYKSYFNPTALYTSARLRLDSIQVLDKAGSILQHYRFDYNTAIALPPYNAKSQDYWGYFNNVNNNYLTPQTSVPYIACPSCSPTNVTIGSSVPNGRNCDSTQMQAFILTGIHYPTGGYSTFTYQTNQYSDYYGLHLAGGLRVKTISSYDGINPTPIVKTYVYNTARANFDSNNQNNISNQYFASSQTHKYWEPGEFGNCCIIGETCTVRTFSSTPHCDLEPWDAATVVYPSVTEYIGTPGNNAGRTDYTFTDIPDTISEASMSGYLIYTSAYYRRGQLQTKNDYIHGSGSSYQLVKSTVNNYTNFQTSAYPNVGLAVGKTVYNEGPNGSNPQIVLVDTTRDDRAPGTYIFKWYNISSKDNYLNNTVTTEYDTSNPSLFTTSKVSYAYDDTTHQQVIATTHVDSKGNTHISNNKYAYDYLNGGTTTHNTVLDSMIQRHMYAEPVEKWDILQNAATSVNAVTGGQLNVYKAGTIANTIVPSKISTLSVAAPLTDFTPSSVVSGNLTGDSRYVQMITFADYDTNNNLTEYKARNGPITTIMWDYLGENPVAQIKNASTNGVAYTSFEASKNGWTYGTPNFDPTAPTGNMSYPLSAGAVTSPNFSTSQPYILSLWANGAAPTVYTGSSYLTATGLNTLANGWTYYEYLVPTGSSHVTLSGSTSVDEIRVYPVNAQMVTYAYDPSGVRTIADTKGMNSFFEYDFAQRLKNIKDWAGNIVKNFGYHTYDQTFGNYVQSASITRNNCPNNTTGGALTYTVPSNKYYSSTIQSANADALYDLHLNGQIKANQNCACNPYLNFSAINSTAATFTATFTGISGQEVYASGTTVLQIPPGTYTTLTVNASDTNTHTYTLGTRTPQSNVHNASFSNVVIATGSSDLTLTIN